MNFGKTHSHLNLVFLPRILPIFDLNKNHYVWPKLTLAYLNAKNDVGYEQIPNTQMLLGFLLLLRAIFVRKEG